MDWQLKEEKCGWLGKSGGLSGYKQKFFRLDKGVLMQYNNEEENAASKMIALKTSRMIVDRKDDKMFKIQAKSKSYYLKARTNEERNAWVESLKKFVKDIDVSRSSLSTLASLRNLVSKKKIRFTEDGFDLDLTYITDKIIAMGYPATGTEALFRNPLSKVKQLLSRRHKDQHKVYNLCSERTYDEKTFQQFGHFPFTDHNTCPLHIIRDFCDDVHEWLSGGEDRVVAIHCKAGKGRAGMMISCYLIRAGIAKSAQEALELFGSRRCYDAKGVRIPSQMRSVHYYERFLKDYVQMDRPFPFDKCVRLMHVRLVTIPDFNGTCDPYFKVYRYDKKGEIVEIFDSNIHHELRKYRRKKDSYIDLPCRVNLVGDIKIKIIHRDQLTKKNEKIAWMWINSVFCPAYGKVVLTKDEVDGAVKEYRSNFDERFQVELFFGSRPPSDWGRDNTELLEASNSAKTSRVNLVRSMVSKQKKRFIHDGFDLDLTYITPQLIAMGFPSEGSEAMYRNPMKEVQRMLRKYHPGRFKVYNLCIEKARAYRSDKFGGSACSVRYGFWDHNACSLQLIWRFCRDVSAFLRHSPDNVAAIHCKAGKGRTGMMISCYLLHSKECKTSEEALKLFAERRTNDGKGVTIASQKRYIRYYEKILKEYVWVDKAFSFTKKKVLVESIKFGPVPNFENGGCIPRFVVYDSNLKEIFSSRSHAIPMMAKGSIAEIFARPELEGDCKVVFYHRDVEIFGFWINPALEGRRIRITKMDLDGASKEHRKIFDDDFYIELFIKTGKRKTISMDLKKDIIRKARSRSKGDIAIASPTSLDLKYVNKRIILMDFNVENQIAAIRHAGHLNKRQDCKYRIYNFGKETNYSPKQFTGEITHFPLHQCEPCPMVKAVQFCESVAKYLSQDEENLIALHVNGGIGSMLIAFYLLWSNICTTSEDAQKMACRNKDLVKVLSPSQQQRITDMHTYIYSYLRQDKKLNLSGATRYLSHIRLHTYPRIKSGKMARISVSIFKDGKDVVKTMEINLPPDGFEGKSMTELVDGFEMAGEYKFLFHETGQIPPICWVWVHTSLLNGNNMVFEKPQIDKACKDIKDITFHEAFSIHIGWIPLS